jgi:hypothetical protein
LEGTTHLAVVDHGSHHSLGQIEAGQVGLGDLAPALPHLDRALNVLVLAGEGAVALGLVQPIVVPVALVAEQPIVGLLRLVLSQHDLVRSAVQTRIAGEIGAELAQTAARGHDLPDERRQGRRLGARAIENGADEQEQQGAGGHEEEGQHVGAGASPAVHALVLALLDNPQLLHHFREEGPGEMEPRQCSGDEHARLGPRDSVVGRVVMCIRRLYCATATLKGQSSVHRAAMTATGESVRRE